MGTNERDEELRRWHTEHHPRYERFGAKVEDVLRDFLRHEQVEVQYVSHRTKTWESFRKKAANLRDPRSEVHDFCGLRIVTYFTSEAQRAALLVRQLFAVEEEHSIDKGKELGADRIGYRAIHLICRLKDPRMSVEEWREFADIRFEVQIATILGHAWAQFEHDRGYKSPVGKLPPELERRMKLAAGLLEVADRELDDIAREVGRYQKSLAKRVPDGSERVLSTIGLDSLSVRRLLVERLPQSVSKGRLRSDWSDNKQGRTAVEELTDFGVRSLADLTRLIPDDYDSKLSSGLYGRNSLLGVCRDLMFIGDIDKYFKEVWSRRAFTAIERTTAALMRTYRVDVVPVAYRHNMSVEEFPDGFDDPEEDDYEPDFDDEGD